MWPHAAQCLLRMRTVGLTPLPQRSGLRPSALPADPGKDGTHEVSGDVASRRAVHFAHPCGQVGNVRPRSKRFMHRINLVRSAYEFGRLPRWMIGIPERFGLPARMLRGVTRQRQAALGYELEIRRTCIAEGRRSSVGNQRTTQQRRSRWIKNCFAISC